MMLVLKGFLFWVATFNFFFVGWGNMETKFNDRTPVILKEFLKKLILKKSQQITKITEHAKSYLRESFQD